MSKAEEAEVKQAIYKELPGLLEAVLDEERTTRNRR